VTPVEFRVCRPGECDKLSEWLNVCACYRSEAQCKDGKSFKE
jgi:hypothetical protein